MKNKHMQMDMIY